MKGCVFLGCPAAFSWSLGARSRSRSRLGPDYGSSDLFTAL